MAKRMFKNLICAVAALLAIFAFVFAGCGEYVPPDSGNNPPPVNPLPGDDDPKPPVTPSGDSFTVQLIWEGGNVTQAVYPNVTKIYAQWTDVETGEIFRSAFNKDGFAENGELDGDYAVTLVEMDASGSPRKQLEGFTYEPNSYRVSNIAKEVRITLYRLTDVGIIHTLGNDRYYGLNDIGAYRTELKGRDDSVMFQFQPKKNGVYSVLTMVDTTANEINPIVDLYVGNSAWIGPILATQDGGGAENSYTKNTKLEYTITADEVGSVFYFKIRSTAINNDAYPLSVDFILDRDGDFANRYASSVEVPVTEDFSNTPATPAGNFEFCITRCADRMLNQNAVKLADDGYYHYYDSLTDTYGEMLFAKITGTAEFLDESFMGPHMGQLLFYVVGGPVETTTPKNYHYFIEEYAIHCNTDGCYPVNGELKTFLQEFSVAQRYFNDGNGFAEVYGNYNADEDSQWLFACGFYS